MRCGSSTAFQLDFVRIERESFETGVSKGGLKRRLAHTGITRVLLLILVRWLGDVARGCSYIGAGAFLPSSRKNAARR